jgi:hypothetical protein
LAQAEHRRRTMRASWPMGGARRPEHGPPGQPEGGGRRQGAERTVRLARRTSRWRLRRWFSAVGPVPGGWGDGLARAGEAVTVVGLISPVVVWKRPTTVRWRGSRCGEVADEASGCDWGWDAVFCVRGDVVKLVS